VKYNIENNLVRGSGGSKHVNMHVHMNSFRLSVIIIFAVIVGYISMF
jgi:hypothetical protein